MSSNGLYSGLYSQIRGCAELLDDVLLHLKIGDSHPSDSKRRELARLLEVSDESVGQDYASHLFKALVLEADPELTENWARLGHALLSADSDREVIPQLEQLASSLENQRAAMLFRMRGRAC
jgi:hypothetical protein